MDGMKDLPVQKRPRLLSDNESSCLSHAFEDYLWVPAIRHLRCAPHHPQTNGKIERFHETHSSDSLSYTRSIVTGAIKAKSIWPCACRMQTWTFCLGSRISRRFVWSFMAAAPGTHPARLRRECRRHSAAFLAHARHNFRNAGSAICKDQYKTHNVTPVAGSN